MHRKFNQNIHLELSLHEVCARDLISPNSSLFQWWGPCLKNVRNVTSLVSFPVSALTLERQKLGSFPQHLNSPRSMSLTGENRTERLQADEHYFCFGWFFKSFKAVTLVTTGLWSQNNCSYPRCSNSSHFSAL